MIKQDKVLFCIMKDPCNLESGKDSKLNQISVLTDSIVSVFSFDNKFSFFHTKKKTHTFQVINTLFNVTIAYL